jgi:hypothetical protein
VRTGLLPLFVVARCTHSDETRTGEQARLAGEAAIRRLLTEGVEDLELFVLGFGEVLSALEDDEATCPAARAPARKRDRRVDRVAKIDERGASRSVGFSSFTLEPNEHDSRHLHAVFYTRSSRIACSKRGVFAKARASWKCGRA